MPAQLPLELVAAVLEHLATPLQAAGREGALGYLSFVVDQLWPAEAALACCLRASRALYVSRFAILEADQPQLRTLTRVLLPPYLPAGQYLGLPLLYQTVLHLGTDDFEDVDYLLVLDVFARAERRLAGWLATVDESKTRLVRSLTISSAEGLEDRHSRQLWSLMGNPGLPSLIKLDVLIAHLALQPTGHIQRPSPLELYIKPLNPYVPDSDVNLALAVERYLDVSKLKKLELGVSIFDDDDGHRTALWVQNPPPLEEVVLNPFPDGDVDLGRLAAILRHHGRALKSFSVSGTVAHVDPSFPPLHVLCPHLEELAFNITSDDDEGLGSVPLIAHALAGGHPKLKHLRIYNDAGELSASPEHLVDVDVDHMEAVARSAATAIHKLLRADRSLFPSLRSVSFLDLPLPPLRIETYRMVATLASHGLIVLGRDGRPWVKPAGADCPLFAPFVLYPYA
jgi:hypothetical protein